MNTRDSLSQDSPGKLQLAVVTLAGLQAVYITVMIDVLMMSCTRHYSSDGSVEKEVLPYSKLHSVPFDGHKDDLLRLQPPVALLDGLQHTIVWITHLNICS